jgi:hypothetical protein
MSIGDHVHWLLASGSWVLLASIFTGFAHRASRFALRSGSFCLVSLAGQWQRLAPRSPLQRGPRRLS